MGKLLVLPEATNMVPPKTGTADQFCCQADGACYIEMELTDRLHSALASQSQVVAGARVVVDSCIRGEADPKGGKAEHISEWLARYLSGRLADFE